MAHGMCDRKLLRTMVLGPMLLVTFACENPVGSSTEPIMRGLYSDVDPLVDRAPSSQPASQRRRDATVYVGGGCSGTLITPRLVLTAAHCVINSPIPTGVQFGVVSASDPARQLSVIGCWRHPSYADVEGGRLIRSTAFTPDYEPCGWPIVWGSWRVRHDMALLLLAERVEWGRAGTIPVVPAPPDFRFIPEGANVRYVGFGGDHPERLWIPATIEHYNDATLVALEGTMFSGDDHFERGDSGGSVYVNDPDLGAIFSVGVISGSPQEQIQQVFINRSWSAPLSHAGNVAWIGQFLSSPIDGGGVVTPVWAGDWDIPARNDPSRLLSMWDAIRPLDLDGDGLIASHDDCPYVYDPEQRDSDRDGVPDAAACVDPLGATRTVNCFDPNVDLDYDTVPDVCDNCPPSACTVASCFASNPDQLDADGNGIGDACEPDRDGDGTIDRRDNCADLENTFQENSNALAERVIGAEDWGDACDPMPVPSLEAEMTPVAVSDTMVRTTTARFSVLGVAAAPSRDGEEDLRSWQLTGFRFCDCPETTRNGVGAQARCALDVGCDVNFLLYARTVSNPWQTMTLAHDGPSPVYGTTGEVVARYRDSWELVDRADDLLRGEWDFLADYTRLGFATTPAEIDGSSFFEAGAMVWTMSLGEVSSAERQAVGDLRDDSFPDCSDVGCPALPRNMNMRSNYWAGLLRDGELPLVPAPSEPIEIIAPFVGSEEFCAECLAAFPRPALSLDCLFGARPCVHARLDGQRRVELPRGMIGLDPRLDATLETVGISWMSRSSPPTREDDVAARLIGVSQDGEVRALVGVSVASDVHPGEAATLDVSQRGGSRCYESDRPPGGHGRAGDRPRGSDCGPGERVPPIGPNPVAPGLLIPMEHRLARIPGYRPDRTGRLDFQQADGFLWQFEGRSPSDGQSSLWRLHIASGVTDRIVMHGALVPDDVFVGALHPSRTWALVLDRTSDGGIRAFAVNVTNGETTRVAVGDVQGLGRETSLELQTRWLRTDQLLLVASSTAGHRLSIYEVSSSHDLAELVRVEGTGRLTGHVAWDRRGVSVYRRGADGVTAVGIPWTEFQPPGPI